MSTATEKTLSLLRDWGFNYWPVERFNQFSSRRTDLYNIIDYLAITENSTIGIQSCGLGFASHINKLTDLQQGETINWLMCSNRKILVIGWRKVLRKHGGKLMVFRPRVAWIYLKNDILFVDEKDTKNYGSK